MTNDLSSRALPAKVIKTKGISAVWIVPILALIFGAWLVYKAFSERGTLINVQFSNASGIVIGKTLVKYKGLTVGTVTNVEATDDLENVKVTIEMASRAAEYITEDALFWYVTADVSFEGISGLDTLLSGTYIGFQPDFDKTGKPQKNFIALSEEPPLNYNTDGLHITLKAKTLGSLSKHSPVTYKQIKVGYVSSYKFNTADDVVDIALYIKPQHAHLVKENSRFWNASGIKLSGSLTSGVSLKTNSLASILAGGIAFDEPKLEPEAKKAETGTTFELYSDYEAAVMAYGIDLTLEWNSGIDVGSPIQYQGITLGYVESINLIDPEARLVTAHAKVNPRIEPYLTEKSQFYVVSPELSLGGVTNVRTILMGTHIGIRPSLTGKKQNKFKVHNHIPPLPYSDPGLHLLLKANDVGSLNTSSGVFYKKIRVGEVQAVQNLGPNNFLVHIHITPEYEKYVSVDSRFWNASGFRVTGGVQNFEVQTQSLQSVLSGGIAFNNAPSASASKPTDGDEFTLFDNKNIADESVTFDLYSTHLHELSTATRIMYRGNRIGSIHQIDQNEDSIKLTVGVLPEYHYILKETSQFWLVKPNISLSGLSDTDALFGGAYINLVAGKGAFKKEFVLSNTPPIKPNSADGLQLVLHTKVGNLVSVGSPISYRGITVGEVDNVSLNKQGENVNINVTVQDKYKHLINSYSRFYNAGGLIAKGSLGDFVIKSESVDAILRGGISFYNPEVEQGNKSLTVFEGDIFTLFENLDDAENAGVAITIYFDDVAGLKNNMNIKYKSQNIGSVERLNFNQDKHGVRIIAFLNDAGKRFATKGTKFWLTQPELGLVGSKNVSSILEGGFIQVLPSSSTEPSNHFIGSNTPPVIKTLPYGLNLKLTSKTLGSVRVDNPVLYRQIKVGKVIGVDLSKTADSVDIYININKRFMPLVKSTSKFWNTSGVNVDFGLFSGLDVESESVETLLAGGIAFATPEDEKGKTGVKANQNDTFKLYDRVEPKWQAWHPKISIGE